MLIRIVIIIVGNNIFPVKFFDARETTIKSAKTKRVKKILWKMFKILDGYFNWTESRPSDI